jgi:Mg2+-importing ATPase
MADATALEVLRHVDSGPRGLTEVQAEQRLERYGENTIPGHRPASWPVRFARALRDPFTAVLLCLGLVSALVASWGTACVITILVLVSSGLRSRAEYQADRSAAGLRDLVATTATVQRSPDRAAAPHVREIPVTLLVPGDVIRLGPGDVVPADVRLLRSDGLTLYQAALTGESVSVVKKPADAPRASRHTGVFDRQHLCFQGSSVESGSGAAVVVATGPHTEFARAYRDHGAHRRRESAFDRAVNGITWILIRFMLLTPPLVLMANAALRGRGLETLPFAVAVAVGLTPEMLPVVVTTVLARNAAALARDHEVIVRWLPALHNLGAIRVLCTDKTGTLTLDRPRLDASLDPDGRPDPGILHWAAVNSLWTLQLADLPVPDPLDEAILDAAAAWGDTPLDKCDGVAVLPFDPVRRLSTAVLSRPGRTGRHTLVVKGAVEDVLDRCTRLRTGAPDMDAEACAIERDLHDDDRDRLRAFTADKAEQGLRMLAVALAERPARLGSYTPSDEHGLTFAGFIVLRDTLAPTAATALGDLTRRGVAVKVITGDHPGTAARVCHDLGFDPGTVVTADRIDLLTDRDLAELADTTTVFARCTPQHKARIVRALRAGGRATGFLGDGANDLPALHASDVGICPRDAVDVTRDTADVVLAAKDLIAIDHAITAGRRSTGTIATYLRIALSSNLGNVIAMLAAGLLLPFLPMLPAQVLLQNLCFDAAQLAFAVDKTPAEALRLPSRLRPRDFLRFITAFGLLNAAADLTTFGILALVVPASAHSDGQSAFHAGWFTENLITQALVMLLLRPGRHRTPGNRASAPIRAAAAALAAIGVLLPLSPLAHALGLSTLPLAYYPLLAVVLVLYGIALVTAKARYEHGYSAAASGVSRLPVPVLAGNRRGSSS